MAVFQSLWTATHAKGLNNIDSAGPTQVIGANGQRVAITFYNPGTVNLYVYSAQVSPAPTSGALGGSFVVIPADSVTIYGGNTISLSALNGAWYAFAASSSNNPITIIEMTQ